MRPKPQSRNEGVKNIEVQIGTDRITLRLDERGSGTIKSTLHITEADEDFGADYRTTYNSAVDGLESLMLAHACAGVDVEHPRYVAGLAATMEAISNHHA